MYFEDNIYVQRKISKERLTNPLDLLFYLRLNVCGKGKNLFRRYILTKYKKIITKQRQFCCCPLPYLRINRLPKKSLRILLIRLLCPGIFFFRSGNPP